MLKYILLLTLPFSLFCNENSIPKMIVKGDFTLHVPADQVVISLGVVTEGPDPKETLQANNEKMQSVIVTLEKLGLTKKEYQTGQFNIQPTYSSPPKEPPT